MLEHGLIQLCGELVGERSRIDRVILDNLWTGTVDEGMLPARMGKGVSEIVLLNEVTGLI